MPHRRTITLLLWAGPMYAVGSSLFLVALDRLSPPGPFALVDTSPLIYSALTLPPVLFLLATACGIWLSLRLLAGRSTPIAAIRHMRFDQMRPRPDELLPLAAGLTVALPALQFYIPMLFAVPTATQFHFVQAPGIFSAWFVLWAVWSMPVSRVMKAYQVLTPILTLLYVLLRDVGSANAYIGLLGLVASFASLLWFFLTPIWLASVIQRPAARTAPVGESSI